MYTLYYKYKGEISMKNALMCVLTAFLLTGNIITPSANNSYLNTKDSKLNITVGDVKHQAKQIGNGKDEYYLDFSCLNISFKDKKIIANLDSQRIKSVSKVKSFTKSQKDVLTNNANYTKSILQSKLSDSKIQSQIYQVIQQHQEKTGSNPIIKLKYFNYKVQNDYNPKLGNIAAALRGTASPMQSGKVEPFPSLYSGQIYTSVSGSGTTAWGQTNVYINNPTDGIGIQQYCNDGVSLSWDSPWKLTNSYTITLKDLNGNTIPSYYKQPIRVPGSSNCLAYDYNQNEVKGAYVGASLAYGSYGGNDFYSTYIHTYSSQSYSFSASGGKYGISVQPTTYTFPVQSSVYFVR